MKAFVVLFLLVAAASAQKTFDNHVEDAGNTRLMVKLLTECSRQEDITLCLKVKAVHFLDRVLGAKGPIQLMESVALVNDAATPTEVLPLQEDALPRALDQRSALVDHILWNRLHTLFSSRSLQFSLPSDVFEGQSVGKLKRKRKGNKKKIKKKQQGVAEKPMDEKKYCEVMKDAAALMGKVLKYALGRKKKDKYGGALLAAAAFGGMLLQMALGKVALIAGKALMVAKVAMVLSAIIGLKKLVGSGGGGDSHQVVYADGGHGWGHRSLDSHEMAYGAHAPAPAVSA